MLCVMCTMTIVFFVKQMTAYEMRISDWSSDVCSSDLAKRGNIVVQPPGDPIGFDFSELVCLEDDVATLGVARLDQQFWKPNIDPTERYTTSPPGSTQYRLKAWDSGFSNIVLAGDWIYTGLNVGSFEGARSEEHTSDLRSLMRISYAGF